MGMHRTDTYLQETILNCIGSAIAEREIIIDGPFRDALKAQSHIGWLDIMRSYWSTEWQQAYERLNPVPADKTRQDKTRQENRKTNNTFK
jgi:hypothetical protein